MAKTMKFLLNVIALVIMLSLVGVPIFGAQAKKVELEDLEGTDELPNHFIKGNTK